MKSLAYFIFVLSLVSLNTSRVSAELKEVKIGILNELTGPVASLGTVCSKGLDLAQQIYAPSGIVNGAAVKFVMADEHDDPKTAVSEYQRMVDQEGVQVMVAIRGKGAMPINPLAERQGIPVVGIAGAPQFTTTNKYSLRMFSNAEQEGSYHAKLAREMKKKRAAIIYIEEEYTSGLATAAAKVFSELGGEIAYQQSILPQDDDFASFVARIKRARVDVVFAYVLTKTGLLVRKLREQGLTDAVYTNYWIQQPEQIEAAGAQALENVFFGEMDGNKPKFREAYNKAFPQETYNPAAYLCYATLGTVLTVMNTPKALENKTALRDALVNVSRVSLLDGDLKFVNREVVAEFTTKTFKDGKVVEVASRQ